MNLSVIRWVSLLAALLCLHVFAPTAHSQVRINEFLAKNSTGLLDEDGETSDWIELFNESLQPVDLQGWTLTDDAADMTQWAFPSVSLGSGEYLVVSASNKDRATPGSPLHTNFKLSTSGEFLALSRPDGSVATIFDPSYPLQSPDVSYGFQSDGVTEAFFDPPTPGDSNPQGSILLPPATVLPLHGVYSTPFAAEISHGIATSELHYTLDGTVPTLASPLYTQPIPVRITTTLRVRGFAAGFDPSRVQTLTYVIPHTVPLQNEQTALDRGMPAQWIQADGQPWTTDEAGTVNGRAGAHYGFESSVFAGHSAADIDAQLRALPSLSVVMHPDDLFGYQAASGRDGIYSNSEEDGWGWERACSAEWIETDGTPGFSIDCGVTIQGGSSTDVNNRGQLSMSLHFRSTWGPSKLDYKVFEDSPVRIYDKLILDSHNQNSVNGFARASLKVHAQEIRDPFMGALIGEMGNSVPHSRYAHVYLNGLYWGVYAIHERPDDDFAAAHRGGDSEEYDYIKRGVVFEGNSNDINETNPSVWSEIVSLTRNPITPGSTWHGQDAWQALQDRVDLEAYADYLLANWYGGNTDWPHNNWTATVHARFSADEADVDPLPKLKFHPWDSETTLLWGGAAWAVSDGFYDRTSRISNAQTDVTLVHWAARHHPDWLMMFADRAHKAFSPGGALYVHPDDRTPGTLFDPQHPERNIPASVYHAMSSVLEPVVHFEYARWANYGYANGTHHRSNWSVERDRLENGFFAFRSNVLKQQLLGATPQLYPTTEAPAVLPASGTISSWNEVSFNQSQGRRVFYTLDGSDPRLPLGGISPEATLVRTGPGANAPKVSPGVSPHGTTQPLAGGAVRVRARAFDGSVWSALESRDYLVGMDLALNELMSRNGSTLADSAGEFDDWFELKNLAGHSFDLTGFYFSDDQENPRKWPITEGTQIAAGAYLIFWADGDLAQGSTHADFSLSGGGEFLGLFAPDGLNNELVDGIDFPSMSSDQSFGRSPDAVGPWVIQGTPSPGASN